MSMNSLASQGRKDTGPVSATRHAGAELAADDDVQASGGWAGAANGMGTHPSLFGQIPLYPGLLQARPRAGGSPSEPSTPQQPSIASPERQGQTPLQAHALPSSPLYQFLYEQPPSRDVKKGKVIRKGDPILGGSCYAYSTLNAIIGSLESPPPAEVIDTWIKESLERGAGGSPMRVLAAAESKDDVVSQELKKYQVQSSPAVDSALGGALAPLKATHAVMLSVNVPSNHWISYLGASGGQISAIDQQNKGHGTLQFTWCAAKQAGLAFAEARVTGVRYKNKADKNYTALNDISKEKIEKLLAKPALYNSIEVEAGGKWNAVTSATELSLQQARDEGWWATGRGYSYHLDGVFLARRK